MSILQLDRFGQLVQTIPAMIPKTRFNHPNVSEAQGDTQEVCVCGDTCKISSNETEVQPLGFGYKYAHLEFRIGMRVGRIVTTATPLLGYYTYLVRNLFKNVYMRFQRDSDTQPVAPHRWYLRWNMVPDFIGIPHDKILESHCLPDAFALTMWLEDYADSVFDSIKSEQYRHGVRLLQTYLMPKTELEKNLNANS